MCVGGSRCSHDPSGLPARCPMNTLSLGSAKPSRRQRILLLTLLFLAAVVALSPGIAQITGVTTADENQLTLRVPLSMMEHDVWIVPQLEGAPRLGKPPMLSWLTRASFEVFGVSLTSGRMVAVLFAALLVIVVALIGFEWTGDLPYSLCAGLIMLSTVGMTIEGRYLMLDVPTAAFSGLAFYWWLRWCRTRSVWLLAGVAIALSAGVLTKGPVAFVVFGSGVLALSMTDSEIRSIIWRGKAALAGSLLLFLGLTAPWFVYVYTSYPDASSVLQGEVAARNIGDLTLLPVIGLLLMVFPWTFVLMSVLIRPHAVPFDLLRIKRPKVTLLLWLGLSILPFVFVKVYVRYLIGSLIPLALLCALMIRANTERAVRVPARLAMIATSFTVLSVTTVFWWFRTGVTELGVVLAAYAVFAIFWWQGDQLFPMALSATMLWMTLAGVLYPTVGFNEIPQRIFEVVKGRPVIIYKDKQPRLLPVAVGRSLTQRQVLGPSDLASEGGQSPLLFTTEEHSADLEQNLRALGVAYERVESYKTLNARDKWVRYARTRSTWDDWVLALKSRSLEPVKLTIVIYALRPRTGIPVRVP